MKDFGRVREALADGVLENVLVVDMHPFAFRCTEGVGLVPRVSGFGFQVRTSGRFQFAFNTNVCSNLIPLIKLNVPLDF